jgi:hypothetical protein
LSKLTRLQIIVLLASIAIAAGAPIVLDRFPEYIVGYLIQIPAMLAAYIYATHFRLLEKYSAWSLRGLLLLSFAIPLQNTFILKAFRKALLDRYVGLEIFRPEVLLLIAIAVWTACVCRKSAKLHPLIIGSFAIGLTGWLFTSSVSDHPALSFATGFFEILCPFIVIYVYVANTPNREFLRHCVQLFMLGCAFVATSQITAALGMLWIHDRPFLPLTAQDFLGMKMNMLLMEITGNNAYGNSDNFVSVWILLVPLFAGLYYSRDIRGWRAVGLIIILYAGLLVYSRSGLLVVCLGLLAIVAYRWLALRKFSTLVAAMVAGLILIHLPGDSFAYWREGVGRFLLPQTHVAAALPHVADALPHVTDAPRLPGGGGSKTEPTKRGAAAEKNATNDDALGRDPLRIGRWAHGDELSGDERSIAWRTGWKIGKDNWLTGIGFGSYIFADPQLTAPHSLFLLRLAEGGILSAVSFLLLILYVLWCSFRLPREPPNMLTAACLIGALCYLLKATVFGATFALGGMIVWGFGFAISILPTMIPIEIQIPKQNKATQPNLTIGER